MYQYLHGAYHQWCSGKNHTEIVNDGEVFIDIVHRLVGYDKVGLRRFLVNQPWFISKVDTELL